MRQFFQNLQTMLDPNARFLHGSTMSHVIRMTLTGMLGLTFMFVVDLANLFWISRFGDEKMVAALGFAWNVQFFSISVGIGLMIGATALVSKAIGQGKREEARKFAIGCMATGVFIQAFIALLIVIFREQIVRFTGATGETALLAERFLMISVPTLPLMAIGMIGSAILRSEGDAYRAMFVTMSAGLVAMVADPILIIWFQLGLDGAAINTGLSRLVSTSIALMSVIKVHNLLARLNMSIIRLSIIPFLIIALPAILTQLSGPFASFLVTRAMAEFGDSAVAGLSVVNRLSVVAFGGIFSLSAAIGGIFGQNYGAQMYERIKSTYWNGIIFCFIYTLVAWLVLALCTEWIIEIFLLGPLGSDVVKSFNYLAAGGFLFSGLIFVSSSVFNNLGRPIYSTIMTWSRDGLVMFPAVIIGASIFGATGVVYGNALAAVAVGLPSCFFGWLFIRKLNH